MKKVVPTILLTLKSAFNATVSRAILLAVLIALVKFEMLDADVIENLLPALLGKV